ncbi:MAG: hypothetical protein HC772_01490 [Leptolyngbyaceae cyanobacterium CRU_2_3]|nr:hypothetical protein [Leptolyngbyaceae cyanobacterium CRU_2_3]
MSQLDAVRVDSVRVESICLDSVCLNSVHAEQAPGESVGDRPTALPLFSLQPAVEDGACLDLKLTLGDYQSLLDELTQAQALDQERVVRIFHLEQALDQALSYLEEMRLQLRDQAILEGQLAATEEYASVQQQAIARFKLQITEQEAALDAQILETQQRDQAIQELLATIESMTQAQQQEIERLRLKLSHDQQEAQTHRSRIGKQFQDFQVALESRQNRVAELEAETLAARTLTTSLQGQLETSQQQIRELSTSLRQYRASLAQLEAQIEQTHTVLEERQNGVTRFQRRPTASAEPASATVLQQDLAKALRQVEALEEQLAQQAIQQTRLQQNHQELEADRDRLLAYETTQDQQIAEMQEQILQQAQHVTEH